MLEAAGVKEVGDFVQMTPNITLREAYRAGVTLITIRGITTGQQGWAPVTYVVDGVPAGSLDAINLGALVGVERIEVLKGPQSALYGAGAIAGAINVITKDPTDEFESEGRVSLGKGRDVQTALSVSGPVVADSVLFRLDGYYRKGDGVLEDQDGDHLDFERQGDIRGKLLFNWSDVKLDVRAHYTDIRAGAAYQEFLPPSAEADGLLDDFDHSPGISRGILGVENRTAREASVKLDWELGGATLTSISAYSKLDQDLYGSTSWQTPPGFGFCGPIGGAGEPPGCFQVLVDDFEVMSQDLRLTSRSDQRLRWLVGAAYLDREAGNLWTAYVDNALDERQANEVNNVGFGYIRVPNRPRTYGLEFSFKL